MWPFRPRNILQGIEKDKKGNFIFSLTEEEQVAVTEQFDMFKSDEGEIVVHPEVADELKRGWTSLGLFNYAKRQIMTCEFEENRGIKTDMINKAIASIIKAYPLCSLPIYMYDLAWFMEMNNRHEDARAAFKSFLQLQEKFKPTYIQETLLTAQGRDIAAAVKDAKRKLLE